jgi:hypothetical protein
MDVGREEKPMGPAAHPARPRIIIEHTNRPWAARSDYSWRSELDLIPEFDDEQGELDSPSRKCWSDSKDSGKVRHSLGKDEFIDAIDAALEQDLSAGLTADDALDDVFTFRNEGESAAPPAKWREWRAAANILDNIALWEPDDSQTTDTEDADDQQKAPAALPAPQRSTTWVRVTMYNKACALGRPLGSGIAVFAGLEQRGASLRLAIRRGRETVTDIDTSLVKIKPVVCNSNMLQVSLKDDERVSIYLTTDLGWRALFPWL